MKLLYVAVHKHRGWGAEYWISKAFKRLGCRVIEYDYRTRRHRLRSNEKLAADFARCQHKHQPDAILVQRADNLPSAVFHNMVAPAIFWSTEPIERNRDTDALLEHNPFDWVYVHTFACLQRIEREFALLRPQSSVLLLAGPAESIHHTATISRPRFALFNRNLSPRRSTWLEPSQHLIEVMQGKYGKAYFAELSRSEVAVNIHYGQESVDDLETGIFEAMARGCAVVSERINPRCIEELGLQEAIWEVDSPQALRDALLELKASPTLLEQYQRRSREAIVHNTWDARAAQILQRFTLLKHKP
jgi:glycosyltransferase involved in cell wall biosynthesis